MVAWQDTPVQLGPSDMGTGRGWHPVMGGGCSGLPWSAWDASLLSNLCVEPALWGLGSLLPWGPS